MRHNNRVIRLGHPVKRWDDGLPLGNGRLGAMLMGHTEEEIIYINEESLWYGADLDRKNPDTRENIDKIRELLLEGKVQQAQLLARLSMTSAPKYVNPYQPAGDLRIYFYDHKESAADYVQSLDLENAIAHVEYSMCGNFYKREHLVSHKYQVLAIHLESRNKNGMTFTVNMSRKPFEEETGRLGTDTVYNCGQCGPDGVHYFTAVRLEAFDGKVQTMGDFVYAENVTEANIYLACKTDFADSSYREDCIKLLDEAQKAGYGRIKEEHLKEYHALYNRMELDICEGEDEEAFSDSFTDELLADIKAGNDRYIKGISELLFHFARYLMISSSYDCIFPSNLQGIWNGEYAPPWQSEFTININEEMNYWIAEKCALPECHMPLFAQLDRMVKKGRKTAKELYGCRGFCAHHNTNIWANTDPEGIFDASPFWPMGGAWLSLHLYEHFLYTQDLKFLKERALPVMWEAIEFFNDYLYHTEDGYYITGPSVSPENTYRSKSGQKGSLCMGPAMDIQILSQLTEEYIEGMKLAGENMQQDKVKIAEDIFKHLPPQRISSDGRVMEWQEEYEEMEPGHRHISHMFALHPGHAFTEETPDLFKAAKKTIESRLAHGGGHTGWSSAWIICFFARLKDGEKTFRQIRSMLKSCIKDNLLDTHPPFQIDGNFGFAEGLIESIVQSHSGYYEFLPALPADFTYGSVKGVILQGAVKADISWKDSKLESVTLTASHPMTVMLKYGSKKWEAELKKGANEIAL